VQAGGKIPAAKYQWHSQAKAEDIKFDWSWMKMASVKYFQLCQSIVDLQAES